MEAIAPVKTEIQSPIPEWIDLSTDKEDDSSHSHTTIGIADTDKDFDDKDIAKALECIIIGHQEASSGYYDLAATLLK